MLTKFQDKKSTGEHKAQETKDPNLKNGLQTIPEDKEIFQINKKKKIKQ